MDNAVLKVNDLGLKSELEKLFSRIKHLVENYNETREINRGLIDKIKELEHEVSELKLEVSNRNSDLLNKDKEIGELKNKLLVEKKNRMSVEEKDMLKSRIRELMARLDTHLESQTSNNF